MKCAKSITRHAGWQVILFHSFQCTTRCTASIFLGRIARAIQTHLLLLLLFDPSTQFPGNEKNMLCNTKKYKNQAGMNLTPPPASQSSHAVRWHCTAESINYNYYYDDDDAAYCYLRGFMVCLCPPAMQPSFKILWPHAVCFLKQTLVLSNGMSTSGRGAVNLEIAHIRWH